MLHYETVSSDLIDVLKKLMKLNELNSFRLVGGTSLALQIGHRKSIDIDLFTNTEFDQENLLKVLEETFSSFTLIWKNQHGLTSQINSVKVDFFNWHTPFIKNVINADDLRLMDKEEIGAMKLGTITGRKEKKDFFDIAFLLEEFSLKHLLNLFKIKYPFIDKMMVIESLTTAALADNSLDPFLLINLEWNTAKSNIVRSIENYYGDQINQIKQQQQQRIDKAEKLLKHKKNK